MSQRNFTQIAGMTSRKCAIKYYTFCYFAIPMNIQSIITWAFFIVLKNRFPHLKAQRISFYLVYLMASFNDVDDYPRLLNFDL